MALPKLPATHFNWQTDVKKFPRITKASISICIGHLALKKHLSYANFVVLFKRYALDIKVSPQYSIILSIKHLNSFQLKEYC